MERERYSEKVHVPLYQPSDGSFSPIVPPSGSGRKEERKDDGNAPFDCYPKKLAKFFTENSFTPSIT